MMPTDSYRCTIDIAKNAIADWLPAFNGPKENKMSNMVIWCWILIAPFVGMIILNFKK